MSTHEFRALIVEDDRSWQQLLSEILTDIGLVVDVVDSLEGAVTNLRSVLHRLAVVDLSLGGGDHHNQDGLRVLDAVRRQDPGCVTIMLTGFATVELAVSVLTDHGAFTCMRKESFHRAQFRQIVGQALASASALDSDEAVALDRAHQEASTDPGVDLGPGAALVVEDDAGWRSILSELLSDAGYQVRLCSSFGEAVGCLRREKYVLAVVDLSLDSRAGWDAPSSEQSLDGYELLSTVRSGGIPSIVVSGVANREDIERAYAEHDIFAYLEKQTFNRRTFLQTVQEARDAHAAGSELGILTERERQVLELLARGLTNKEIAEVLVITTNTVKRHLKAVFRKLDVHTRSAAAAKAISAGIPASAPDES